MSPGPCMRSSSRSLPRLAEVHENERAALAIAGPQKSRTADIMPGYILIQSPFLFHKCYQGCVNTCRAPPGTHVELALESENHSTAHAGSRPPMPTGIHRVNVLPAGLDFGMDAIGKTVNHHTWEGYNADWVAAMRSESQHSDSGMRGCACRLRSWGRAWRWLQGPPLCLECVSMHCLGY